MNDLDVQLDNLDEQLLAYEPRIRWALYITAGFAILLMGWMFYLSDSIDELNTLKEQNQELVNQISENSPEAYRRKISQSSANIMSEEMHITNLENERQELLQQMSNSKGLIFDNRQYAATLDLLLERSVRSGLKLELMKSEDTNTTFYGKLKEYKKLTITGIGKFSAIVDFLTFIESQNQLIQIQSVQIRSDENKPHFEAIILYMGVGI